MTFFLLNVRKRRIDINVQFNQMSTLHFPMFVFNKGEYPTMPYVQYILYHLPSHKSQSCCHKKTYIYIYIFFMCTVQVKSITVLCLALTTNEFSQSSSGHVATWR